MKNVFPANITRFFGKASLYFRRHAPGIMTYGGCTSIIAGVFMACKATLKANRVLDEAKDRLDYIRKDDTISEEEHKKEILAVKIDAAKEVAIAYLPSVALIGGGLSGVMYSHAVMRNRLTATAAAYAALQSSYIAYRERVAKRFGETVEQEIRKAVVSEEVVELDKGGKEVKKTIAVSELEPSEYSEYARFFDQCSVEWSKDAEYNNRWLRIKEAEATNKLRRKGYLFLNEVYEMLDIPPSQAGQVVGWIYDKNSPISDGEVKFGLDDPTKPAVRRFVNGLEPAILLDFNVDGDIVSGDKFLLANSKRR